MTLSIWLVFTQNKFYFYPPVRLIIFKPDSKNQIMILDFFFILPIPRLCEKGS